MAAILLEGVSKRFTIQHERPRSFQELLVNFLHRKNGTTEEFWALRDVSFAVEAGETFGIIGPNGSGKSTILKLVTRILEPTTGRISVDGKVAALIELGAGFHPDLTGRENIYLLGAIMGFSAKQMRQRFDRIVQFAEVEQFIDTAIKHYSSGMATRLGFAVAINLDADTLLIDEVLAVGDLQFQEKCLDTIEEFQRQGKTLLMVSHDLGLISRFCHRALLLQHGRIESCGPTREVVEHYTPAYRQAGP